MEDAIIGELKQTSRRLQDPGEDTIIKQLVPDIIPPVESIPDHRLEDERDQALFDSAPAPLNQNTMRYLICCHSIHLKMPNLRGESGLHIRC
ncbi:hypothetical protein Z517_09501 [Fonsecaea pedrosoi CBS 271.37]|uniref:Uncharacterized protein n=1 Tax=Fonsecaea pedrosoi CBS 271.37 TaxID=1442368 RepID=A0A0D2GEM8_9EURO|nr:uncharacterized protein Z517_09501 [Fonsecaea pedrosoi CBS 271.37]KIW77055.1 hypothetical protein Z517_09501 [Fonsecaea pedrosoi CBS 271.37]